MDASQNGANRWHGQLFTTAAKLRRRIGRLESLERGQLLVADLVISEFMASPTNAAGNIQDKDGDYSDWIEIHNTTAAPINLAGWSLTDKSNDLDQWVFPNQTLAANGYLVVFASEKDLRTPGQELHTNFKLGGGGEYLALVAPDGVTFGSQFTPSTPTSSTTSPTAPTRPTRPTATSRRRRRASRTRPSRSPIRPSGS